jgi:hypothetical protein
LLTADRLWCRFYFQCLGIGLLYPNYVIILAKKFDKIDNKLNILVNNNQTTQRTPGAGKPIKFQTIEEFSQFEKLLVTDAQAKKRLVSN